MADCSSTDHGGEEAFGHSRLPIVTQGVTPACSASEQVTDTYRHCRGYVLSTGQNPFATILSCADSRIAPELCFDTARGDLFVCRVAGNFASDEMVASLEYAVQVLKTPLIMVLGHEACGAVDATIKSVKD